jgi:hypothetical protein
MPWWTNALYDTCSLITLDKILLDHAEMGAHFQPLLSIEPCFRADQLRQEITARMQPRVTYLDMPSVSELTRILTTAKLSKALA